MPYADAIRWALTQEATVQGDTGEHTVPVTKDDAHLLVDKVREYFNIHSIEYGTFSYDDLVPYLASS